MSGRPLPSRLAVAAIGGYSRLLSPLLAAMGVRCRFHPTCSAYAAEAYRTHGFWRASSLTAYRLLRCQPLCEGGEDPVPGPKGG